MWLLAYCILGLTAAAQEKGKSFDCAGTPTLENWWDDSSVTRNDILGILAPVQVRVKYGRWQANQIQEFKRGDFGIDLKLNSTACVPKCKGFDCRNESTHFPCGKLEIGRSGVDARWFVPSSIHVRAPYHTIQLRKPVVELHIVHTLFERVTPRRLTQNLASHIQNVVLVLSLSPDSAADASAATVTMGNFLNPSWWDHPMNSSWLGPDLENFIVEHMHDRRILLKEWPRGIATEPCISGNTLVGLAWAILPIVGLPWLTEEMALLPNVAAEKTVDIGGIKRGAIGASLFPPLVWSRNDLLTRRGPYVLSMSMVMLVMLGVNAAVVHLKSSTLPATQAERREAVDEALMMDRFNSLSKSRSAESSRIPNSRSLEMMPMKYDGASSSNIMSTTKYSRLHQDAPEFHNASDFGLLSACVNKCSAMLRVSPQCQTPEDAASAWRLKGVALMSIVIRIAALLGLHDLSGLSFMKSLDKEFFVPTCYYNVPWEFHLLVLFAFCLVRTADLMIYAQLPLRTADIMVCPLGAMSRSVPSNFVFGWLGFISPWVQAICIGVVRACNNSLWFPMLLSFWVAHVFRWLLVPVVSACMESSIKPLYTVANMTLTLACLQQNRPGDDDNRKGVRLFVIMHIAHASLLNIPMAAMQVCFVISDSANEVVLVSLLVSCAELVYNFIVVFNDNLKFTTLELDRNAVRRGLELILQSLKEQGGQATINRMDKVCLEKLLVAACLLNINEEPISLEAQMLIRADLLADDVEGHKCASSIWKYGLAHGDTLENDRDRVNFISTATACLSALANGKVGGCIIVVAHSQILSEIRCQQLDGGFLLRTLKDMLPDGIFDDPKPVLDGTWVQDGNWVQATITGTRLHWNNGHREDVDITITDGTSFKMPFRGESEPRRAVLEKDGKIHWDHGEVWIRVNKVSDCFARVLDAFCSHSSTDRWEEQNLAALDGDDHKLSHANRAGLLGQPMDGAFLIDYSGRCVNAAVKLGHMQERWALKKPDGTYAGTRHAGSLAAAVWLSNDWHGWPAVVFVRSDAGGLHCFFGGGQGRPPHAHYLSHKPEGYRF